jgi:hypothetical protein
VSLSRRLFLQVTPLAAATPVFGARQVAAPAADALPSTFPAHDPDLAREMVTVAHGNAARVRELLAARSTLANASWDWGYGDWETALGAASHVGNREIAALLLGAGAHATLFSATMLGQLETVKAFVAASPGVQRTRGPHGITLLAHARAGGAGSAAVLAFLESLGDADPRYTNEPLSDVDRAAIAGIYRFGPAPTERMIVAVSDRGPSIQRDGASPRNLMHLGGRVFHPVGAFAVRLRFSAGDRADAVTIEEGPRVVVGKRVQ